MKKNKLFVALTVFTLSSSLLLSNGAYANMPTQYSGASASDMTLMAKGSVTYDGNIVTLPAVIKEDKSRNFIFDNTNELYFAVENETTNQEIDATITTVKEDSRLVNLSFDISQMSLDKPYRLRVYTNKMFSAVQEPADLVFKMEDKLVTITSEGIVTVTSNKDKQVTANTKDEQVKTSNSNKVEEVSNKTNEVNVEKTTSATTKTHVNKSSKILPNTAAVK